MPTPPEAPKGPVAIVNLWPTVFGKVNPNLRVFLPEMADPNLPACIICPGGGYEHLSIDKEGHDVARWLHGHGIAAFVLEYRMPGGVTPAMNTLPVPNADAARAIRLVRAQAGKWNIDQHRVGILGFSAGGHVAATAATKFDNGLLADSDPVQQQSSRPDFAVLVYPVISMHAPVTHGGSRDNLLGKNASVELMNHFSADLQVTAQTPPLFITHAEDDMPVPVQNSLQMTSAAVSAGVPVELKLVKTGGHGYGLGVNGGDPTVWPGLCIDWMRSRGILTKSGS